MTQLSFQLQAATDAALTALMLEHGMMVLGEGPPRLADGVLYSHIGAATIEGGAIPLPGRYAFVSLDQDKFTNYAAVFAALGPHLYSGPPIRYLMGGTNYDISSDVPPAVTMRQARLALLGAGKLAAVEAALNAMQEPTKTAAKITWEFSGAVERKNGLVSQLGPALGMTEAQIDELFKAAAKL